MAVPASKKNTDGDNYLQQQQCQHRNRSLVFVMDGMDELSTIAHQHAHAIRPTSLNPIVPKPMSNAVDSGFKPFVAMEALDPPLYGFDRNLGQEPAFSYVPSDPNAESANSPVCFSATSPNLSTIFNQAPDSSYRTEAGSFRPPSIESSLNNDEVDSSALLAFLLSALPHFNHRHANTVSPARRPSFSHASCRPPAPSLAAPPSHSNRPHAHPGARRPPSSSTSS